MMIKNIVLAVDGSNHAENAAELAIDMANKYQANLTIVHVLTHDHPSGEIERMIEVEYMDDADKSEKSRDQMGLSSVYANHQFSRKEDKEFLVINRIGEQIIKAVEQRAKSTGLDNFSSLILNGNYANEILRIAEEQKADLIVMGRRGLNTLKGFMTGSVSHKVSQRAECSVMTVK